MVEVEAKKVVLKNLAGEYLVPITEPYVAGEGIKIEDNVISADVDRIAKDVVDSKVELNGPWVVLGNKNAVITTTKDFGSYTYNIADILPNDEHSYEVKIFIYGQNDTTSANNIGISISGSEMPNSLYNAGEISFVTDGYAQAASTCGSIVVKPSRDVYILIDGTDKSKNSFKELQIKITGYKRLKN